MSAKLSPGPGRSASSLGLVPVSANRSSRPSSTLLSFSTSTDAVPFFFSLNESSASTSAARCGSTCHATWTVLFAPPSMLM